MTEESSTEKQTRLSAGRCCWHCSHYVRPAEAFQLDGPLGSICTVERKKGSYGKPDTLRPGDKQTAPDDFCERFTMDLPPATGPQD